MREPKPQTVQSHTMAAKIFHWGFIVVFIYALAKQVNDVEDLADAALFRFEGLFALGFLALLVVRFVYMHRTRPTALPATVPRLMKMLARIGHLAMYISLAMIAISGLFIGAVFSSGGPDAPAMAFAVGLHELSVAAAYVSIAFHIAAALFHRFKRDGIWSSMVPIWQERES